MDINGYVRRKESLTSRLLETILWILLSFVRPNMSRLMWNQLVRVLYPTAKQARDEATILARQFFDDTREANLGPGRVDFYRDDNYPIEWFAEALEPAFQKTREDWETEDIIQDLNSRITKIIEDGARRTLLSGVRKDEKTLGWARYDPRPPTCAFCTMMISRGPDYTSARTAGADLDDKTAEELWDENTEEALNKLQARWHPNCTCIVVPVYEYEGYPTQVQEDAAFEIYKRARKLANSGKYKEILKAMRVILRDERENADDDATRLPAA